MECLLEELVDLIGNAMPDLEVVDEDYGQLEMLDQESRDIYPLTFPAVLIDAPSAEWSNIGGLNQKGTATIRVRLIIDCYDDTHHHSTTTHLIARRKEKRHELHKLLQGHRIGEDSALIRTNSRFYTANHGIKVYESTYTATVTEMLEPQTVMTQAKPKIVAQVLQ
ncbi:MAG: hypothetical protein IJ307_05790 [Bacteroidales bacterium]|nr:hypothetical protein [Bacteroidales bacterium]